MRIRGALLLLSFFGLALLLTVSGHSRSVALTEVTITPRPANVLEVDEFDAPVDELAADGRAVAFASYFAEGAPAP